MAYYTPSTRTGRISTRKEYDRIATAFNDVEADTLPLVGWEDYLLANLDLGKSVDSPTFKVFKDNFKYYAFPDSAVKEGLGDLHVLHNISDTSLVVYPHVHWSTNAATPSGACQWKMDYMYARGHRGEAFGTQITETLPPDSPTVQYEHMITESTAGVTLVDLEPDMMVLLRVYRDTGDAADTLVGDAFLFRVDFHVLVDGLATNEKAAPFTKV